MSWKEDMIISQKKRIVFDVDGTLITAGANPEPRHDVIALANVFDSLGWEVWVHSGGGVLYAKHWVERLEMDKMMHINIAIKGDKKIHYDIAVDDCLEEAEWTHDRSGNYIDADYYINV